MIRVPLDLKANLHHLDRLVNQGLLDLVGLLVTPDHLEQMVFLEILAILEEMVGLEQQVQLVSLVLWVLLV